MPQFTFTLDVEDPRPHGRLPQRFDVVTREVLAWLEGHSITGTFFVVATAAQAAPELVREIVRAGHEVALHSWDHRPLTALTTEEFKQSTAQGKTVLEGITGLPVVGYRAPVFSLTESTLWAPDVLMALGFSYSSSVLPAANPLFGFPEAPDQPFRWPSGLLEIPAPTAKFGKARIPFLGGFYFRYLPFRWVHRQIARMPTDQMLWGYCHPYDFDTQQGYFRMQHATHWVSLLLWMRRHNTFEKFERLFADDNLKMLPPFAQQVESDQFDHLVCFEPGVATDSGLVNTSK